MPLQFSSQPSSSTRTVSDQTTEALQLGEIIKHATIRPVLTFLHIPRVKGELGDLELKKSYVYSVMSSPGNPGHV